MSENLFARKPKKLNELFKDERALYAEFLPEKLPCREKEIQEIVFALEPVTHNKKPRNLFLFGVPGTGKTVVAKFVLKQLQEFTGRAKGILVNCFEFNSRHSVLTEIAFRLGVILPRRGVSVDEAFSAVVAELAAKKICPIIVLDEADQLLSEKDGSILLYELLRLPAEKNLSLGIIIISNKNDLVSGLDERVKSSLNAQQLEFEKYSPQQLKQILSERCEIAFLLGAVEKDSIALAAAHAAKLNGDARIAIDSLLQAGRLAERENASSVKPEHLRKVFDSVDKTSIEKRLAFVDENELAVLKVLADLPEQKANSGELFLAFSKKANKAFSERYFRDVVARLVEMRLIVAEDVSLETRGKTRLLSLNVSKTALLDRFKNKA